MRFFLLMPVLAVGVLTGPAEGQQSTVDGVGTSSCGTWTAARSTHSDAAAWGYTQWILGYLSGIAVWSGAYRQVDPLNGTDKHGVWAWVDNYCQTHPLDPIGKAGNAFVDAHRR